MSNPYLPKQAEAITNQVTQNLQRNILPGINSNAIAAGGFGGSRQGIAQGIAIGDTNQGLSNSLANLYGNAYAQDQQIASQQAMQQAALQNQMQIAQMGDATSRLGMQNQYNLGLGNLGLGAQNSQNQFNLGMGQLGLGYYNADQNFFTNQRGQDMQALGLGANLFNQGNSGLAAGGQGQFNAGQAAQNAPLSALQQYAQLLAPFTGLNSSQTQSQPGGSTMGNVMGGALTAAQLWRLLSGGN